jgi:uncharacterized membrane protein YesL
MAQGEKKGFIARMLEGKERDENYARSTLPTGRWSLFWDIFKGRFSKLVIVNLLIIVFCIPLVAVYFLRYMMVVGQGTMLPANMTGIAWPAMPDIAGLEQQMILSTDLLWGALMVAAGLIAAVGISGGIYVIRNLVWTEGIFVANDFWRGIKINIVNVLQSTLFYGVFLYLFTISIDAASVVIATGSGNETLLVISQAICYIAIALLTMVYLWMLSMSASYKLKFFRLLKNSLLMTFGMIFHNIFFVVLMAIPVILILLGSFFAMIGYIILILFGISYMLLVWFDYSQWVFDKYFESKREGGKVNRGIYPKAGKGGEQSKAVQQYEAEQAEAAKIRSDLASRPIKPITDDLKVYELPESFSRDDLKKLRESKEAIVEDTEKYAEEHKGDEKYVVYNARFEQPAEEEEKADGKKDGKKGGSKKKKGGSGK